MRGTNSHIIYGQDGNTPAQVENVTFGHLGYFRRAIRTMLKLISEDLHSYYRILTSTWYKCDVQGQKLLSTLQRPSKSGTTAKILTEKIRMSTNIRQH
jgi:hypothetical protein